MTSDGGKGSAPRPFSVDQQTYQSNWDTIFGRNKRDTNNNNATMERGKAAETSQEESQKNADEPRSLT